MFGIFLITINKVQIFYNHGIFEFSSFIRVYFYKLLIKLSKYFNVPYSSTRFHSKLKNHIKLFLSYSRSGKNIYLSESYILKYVANFTLTNITNSTISNKINYILNSFSCVKCGIEIMYPTH